MSSFSNPHFMYLFDMKNGKKKLAYGQSPEDALEILRLRLSDEEMASLEAEGVIGTDPVLDLPAGITFESVRDIVRELFRLPHEKMLEMGAIQAVEPDYRQRLGLEEAQG